MQFHHFLNEHSETILEKAVDAVKRAHLAHYAEGSVTRSRLAQLLSLTSQSLEEHDLAHVTTWAKDLAEERFKSGFDLSEVQTAMNVLEEAVWEHCVRLLPASDLAAALGQCSTVLGAAKDRLARAYVTMATGKHVASIDQQALFTGTEVAVSMSMETDSRTTQ